MTTTQITAQLLTGTPADDVSPLEKVQPASHEYAPYKDELVGKKSHEISDLKSEVDEVQTKLDDKEKALDKAKEQLSTKDDEIKRLKSEIKEAKEVERDVVSDSRNDSNNDTSASTSGSSNSVDDGTKERQQKISTKKEPEKEELKEKKGVTYEATAYTAYCSTGCIGVTATGVDVSGTTHYKGRNVIAVDPSHIPLGSKVRIKAGGRTIEAIAEDTGGNIKGNRIDILVGSKSEAMAFGRQSVEVEVIE